MAILTAIIVLAVIAAIVPIAVSAVRNYLAREEMIDAKIDYWETIAAR